MPNFKRELLGSKYSYITRLSPEAIAWEFLRRNSAYQTEYYARREKDAAPIASTAGEQWGLRFRGIS